MVNAELTRAAAPHGLYYAPDPSSQSASTIGGNVAENAGGPHCLAYGVTTDHVLALEGVTAAGEVLRFGGYPDGADSPGYDLSGLLTGSEGNLAFVTGVTVRLLPRMEAVSTLLALFGSVAGAGAGASAVIAAGIIPAALEFVDGTTIGALRQGGFRDYPAGAEAVLLVELEGLAGALPEETGRVLEVLLEAGATEVRTATAAGERARLWAGRKGALGAFGNLAPNYYIQDGVVPRSRMVEVLQRIQALAAAGGPADRQRLPRRRRQPAPHHPLRRPPARTDRARRRRRGGDPALLRRRRGHPLRGARRGAGEAGLPGLGLGPGRPGGAAGGQARLRPPGPPQSGQALLRAPARVQVRAEVPVWRRSGAARRRRSDRLGSRRCRKAPERGTLMV